MDPHDREKPGFVATILALESGYRIKFILLEHMQ